jgi:hypothetical protein
VKIVVTPIAPDAITAAVTLGDDSVGDVIVDPPLLPTTRRPAQVEPLAFGARQFAVGRGNRLTNFKWRVARDHTTEAAAATFVLGHDAAVPVNCSMVITHQAGDTTFSAAVITAVNLIEHYGRATTVEYVVEGATPAA